jgi:hypothetical protein
MDKTEKNEAPLTSSDMELQHLSRMGIMGYPVWTANLSPTARKVMTIVVLVGTFALAVVVYFADR